MNSANYERFIAELNAKDHERLDYISESVLLSLNSDEKKKAKNQLKERIAQSDGRAAVAFASVCNSDEVNLLDGWLELYDLESQLRVNTKLWCRKFLDETVPDKVLETLDGNNIECKKFVVRNLYVLSPEALLTKLLRIVFKEGNPDVRSVALDEILFLCKKIDRKHYIELFEYTAKSGFRSFYPRLAKSSTIRERKTVVREIWNWIKSEEI